MSVFKLSLLLLSSISSHLCLGGTETIGPEDQIIGKSIRERVWRHAGIPSAVFIKITIWLTTAAEWAVVFGSPLRQMIRWPATTSTMSVLLTALGPAEASRFTVPFLFGTSLIIVGAFIRVQSFRTLGLFFTFELCIRKDHKLVTRGPYTVVRHPCYAGLMMCIVGWCIVHGEPGSWLRTSGVLDAVSVRVWFACWYVLNAACIVTVFQRAVEEDAFLARRFGGEWEVWARRVKYKLLPFVY